MLLVYVIMYSSYKDNHYDRHRCLGNRNHYTIYMCIKTYEDDKDYYSYPIQAVDHGEKGILVFPQRH